MAAEYASWKGARSPEAQQCWAAVGARVQGDMTRGNHAIYFLRSRGLALDAHRLVVGAPNPSAAEGLETLFAPHIRRALAEQGQGGLAVHVVLLPTRIDVNGDEVVDVDGALADIPAAPRDVRLVAP